MKKHYSDETLGYIIVISDMLLYGLYSVFANKFSKQMDPLLFGGVTTLLGSFPLMLLLKKQKQLHQVFKKENRRSLLTVALLTGFSTLLFFIGTHLTSGINTGLLLQVEPIYSMFIAAILLHEIIHPKQAIATVLMVLGTIAVVFKGFDHLNIGDLLLLLVPLFNQISHVVTKHHVNQTKNPYIVPTARLFYGGIGLTLLAVILHPSHIVSLFNLGTIITIILFSIILRSLDFAMWYQAITKLPLAKASAFLPLSVGVSFVGAVIFLHERPTLQQFFGLSCIFIGMIILSVPIQKMFRARVGKHNK